MELHDWRGVIDHNAYEWLTLFDDHKKTENIYVSYFIYAWYHSVVPIYLQKHATPKEMVTQLVDTILELPIYEKHSIAKQDCVHYHEGTGLRYPCYGKVTLVNRIFVCTGHLLLPFDGNYTPIYEYMFKKV